MVTFQHHHCLWHNHLDHPNHPSHHNHHIIINITFITFSTFIASSFTVFSAVFTVFTLQCSVQCSLFHVKFSVQKSLMLTRIIMCPRNSYPFYIVSYYTKWVTTSWTYSPLHYSYNFALQKDSNIQPVHCVQCP